MRMDYRSLLQPTGTTRTCRHHHGRKYEWPLPSESPHAACVITFCRCGPAATTQLPELNVIQGPFHWAGNSFATAVKCHSPFSDLPLGVALASPVWNQSKPFTLWRTLRRVQARLWYKIGFSNAVSSNREFLSTLQPPEASWSAGEHSGTEATKAASRFSKAKWHYLKWF